MKSLKSTITVDKEILKAINHFKVDNEFPSNQAVLESELQFLNEK